MSDVRILKLAGDSISGDQWARGLASFEPAAILKQEPGAAVHLALIHGQSVVVKSLDLSSQAARLAARLHLSRLHRQWRGHQRLAAAGIATSQPVCLARIDSPIATPQLLLVLRHVEGKSLLQHLSDQDLSASAQHHLARLLGDQIGSIARARLRNRDHKLSNLIVMDAEGVTPRIVVIDAAGVGNKRKGTREQVASRMLFSAIVEPTGLRLPVRRSLQVRVARACAQAMLHGGASRQQRRLLTRRLLRQAARRLAHHGDPTPRTNPLT